MQCAGNVFFIPFIIVPDIDDADAAPLHPIGGSEHANCLQDSIGGPRSHQLSLDRRVRPLPMRASETTASFAISGTCATRKIQRAHWPPSRQMRLASRGSYCSADVGALLSTVGDNQRFLRFSRADCTTR